MVDNRRREDVLLDLGFFDYIKFSGLYWDVYLVEMNLVWIIFNWEVLDVGIIFIMFLVDFINGNVMIDIKMVVENEMKVN